jgi:hypothetical protein
VATGPDHPALPAKATADKSLLSTIEPPKIIDLIISKQTQYYTLWAVYTAVQFAAGGFGYGTKSLPLGVGLAVLAGVWAFNLGHLGFVLQCVTELNRLTIVLNAALDENMEAYRSALQGAFRDMAEGTFFWRVLKQGKQLKRGEVAILENQLRSYGMNIFVHFWIDMCASLALLIRVDNSWIHDHVPTFLQGTG